MGFPNGLQWIEGGTYVTVQDQQLLKSLDIHGLLLANGKMWVAAGTAGVHRYQNGVWEWFQPQGPGGLGCNYVTSMAADSAGETVYVACNQGIWYTKNTGGTGGLYPPHRRESCRGTRVHHQERSAGGHFCIQQVCYPPLRPAFRLERDRYISATCCPASISTT